MRIGFDGRSLGSPSGGIRRYAAELLAALVRTNPSDRLVVFDPPAGRRPPDAVELRRVPHAMPTNLGWSLINLPRAIRRERLDLFHAPAYTAPLRLEVPLVLTIHDVSYERHPEWYPYRRDFVRRQFYRRSALAADAIITDSEFSRREIAEAYDLDPDRISVVQLGVGAPFTAPPPAQKPATISEQYVLHVGDLHPRRNLSLLVNALARLRSRGPGRHLDPVLVLAGVDRGEGAALDEQARRAGVRIHFARPADDAALVSLYAGASVFAYPSRYEGFGLPLLEAMACGAPVVAARAAATPEVVGDAALLVDPDDDGAMASAISRLIEDSRFANQMREAGRNRATRFTWDITATATARVYRSAVTR